MSTVEQEQEQHGALLDGGWFSLASKERERDRERVRVRETKRAFSGIAMQRGVKTVVAQAGE